MDQFTPWSATLGGMLIGLSAIVLMAFNGKIAGISGIFWGGLTGSAVERGWRLAFLLGLVLGPVLYRLMLDAPAFEMNASPVMVIAGGLLVGVGTRLGSGCTSGHGVCGLARLSARSLIAVLAFMASGMVTVGVLRHVVAGG
jgi:uncharacterized membrane protein YedE/YeeE